MSRCNGFTLLELLLAAALSAILMVGVLGVVSNLGDLAVAEPEVAAGDPSLEAFLDLLGEDLEHAQAVDTSQPNRVRLTGPVGLNAHSRERSHRPVEVEYTLQTIAGERWIVRRQASLDELTNRNVQIDLVCRGIGSLNVAGRTFKPPASMSSNELLLLEPSDLVFSEGTLEPTPGDAAAKDKGAQTVESSAAAGPSLSAGIEPLRAEYSESYRRMNYFYEGNWYFREYLPPRVQHLATSLPGPDRSAARQPDPRPSEGVTPSNGLPSETGVGREAVASQESTAPLPEINAGPQPSVAMMRTAWRVSIAVDASGVAPAKRVERVVGLSGEVQR